MNIRQATAEDFGRIMSLYRDGLEEMGETKIIDSCLLKKVANSFLEAPCFVVVKNGNIVGIAGLTVILSSHNGDASLAEYMLYIQPEYRSIKTLNALVKECKAFAASKDLPLRLEFRTETNDNVRERLFRINGFKVAGIIGEYNV